MSKNNRWLLLPPAVAILLVLGPLSMSTDSSKDQPTKKAAPAATAPANETGKPSTGTDRPALPRTPDLWQMTSTLIGVLLLGTAGVFVVRRLQRGAKPVGSGAITLRQTVRLSARQAVHAIEFDGKLLLVGEGERGMQLLHAAGVPDHAADEATVAARSIDVAVTDDDDEGAVPKNLVIPRPAPAAANAPAATPPRARTGLGDFRTLLAKAGR